MIDTSHWTDRRVVFALAMLALCAYATALGGVFVYDDTHSVRDNVAIRSVAEIPRFFWDVDAFSDLAAVRMYRPVVLTTFAIDHAVGGGVVWMFKLGNVLIHAVCAALLFSLTRSLGIGRRPAVIAAALFAAHPMVSEAVNIVSARSDLLVGLGLLVGLRSCVAAREGSKWAWCGVGLGTVIACGSKETGVMMPGLLVLLELLDRRPERSWRSAVLRILPAVVVTVAYLVARKAFLGVATGDVPKFTGGHDALNGAGRDLLTQFCVMSSVLPRFFSQSVLPVGLTIDPWIPLHDEWASAPVLCGWAAIATLTYLGLRAPKRRPLAFFGTGLAWAMALPWVVLPLNLPACEHRFYAPLIGLGLVLAACVPRELARRKLAATGAIVLVFGCLASARSLDFHDSETLWRDALDKHPRSVRALCGLALEHRYDAEVARLRGDEKAYLREMREACARLERAIRIYPSHYAARRNLAEFHITLGAAHGDPERAVALAAALVDVETNNPFYRLLWSRALGSASRFDEAVDAALSCLEVAEAKGLVYRTAASARAASGDLDAAIELLDQSVARGLDHESVLLQRAEYSLDAGRLAEARRDLGIVLSRNPFDGTAIALMQRVRAARPR